MGIFNDNVKNDTSLHQFHNYLKKTIESQFNEMYISCEGDLTRVSSIFNREFGKTEIQKLFKEHKIYHPYFHCQFLVGEDYFGYINIKISYSDDPTIYIHNKAKIFLSFNLPTPSLL